MDLGHQIFSGFISAGATTYCCSAKQKQVVLIMSEGNAINSTWISTSVNITTGVCVVVLIVALIAFFFCYNNNNKNKSFVLNNERVNDSQSEVPLYVQCQLRCVFVCMWSGIKPHLFVLII